MHHITSFFSRSTANDNRIPLIGQEERTAHQPAELRSAPIMAAVPDHIQQTPTASRTIDPPLLPTLEDAQRSIGYAIRDRQTLAASADAAGDHQIARRNRYIAQAMSAYHSPQAIDELSIRDVHLNRIAEIIEEHAQQFVSEHFQQISNFVDRRPSAVANSFKKNKHEQIKKVMANYLKSDIGNLIPGVNIVTLTWQYRADSSRAQAIKKDRLLTNLTTTHQDQG